LNTNSLELIHELQEKRLNLGLVRGIHQRHSCLEGAQAAYNDTGQRQQRQTTDDGW